MRILVTGCSGFVGGHLLEALLTQPTVEVAGLARHEGWPADLAHLAARVRFQTVNLAEPHSADAILADFRPERVYHLAGYPHVGKSFHEQEVAWADNLTGSLNLYDAIARHCPQARVLHVSSGLIYGDPRSAEQTFDEEQPLRPTSPYAASKAAADLAAYQYSRAPGLAIVRARPFNHIGPRQSPEFAVASFARQIARIEAKQTEPVLETGDLRPQRDLTDVRDVVQAYILLMEKGRSGEAYNVGSGETHSMQSIVERLVRLAGIQVEVRAAADRLRAADAAVVRGDAGKLRRELGWSPRFTLEQTLMDTLQYWRDRMKAGPV
jgi:GDP-4-dehydro-6-deoxy-D-mannose reductase